MMRGLFVSPYRSSKKPLKSNLRVQFVYLEIELNIYVYKQF